MLFHLAQICPVNPINVAEVGWSLPNHMFTYLFCLKIDWHQHQMSQLLQCHEMVLVFKSYLYGLMSGVQLVIFIALLIAASYIAFLFFCYSDKLCGIPSTPDSSDSSTLWQVMDI